MTTLLSEISDDFLKRVMAFEKLLQERTMEYGYTILMEDTDDGERIYSGEFSMQKDDCIVSVKISEFDTVISAEGYDNDWFLGKEDTKTLADLLWCTSEFTYAGLHLSNERCWYPEEEMEITLRYRLPVVDEYCCSVEGYAEMIIETFILFRAEAFMFAQEFQKL